MRTSRTIVQTLAAALAAGLVAAGSAGAEVLTPNLVENPGAELGSSLQGPVVPSIPSWERQGAISSKLSTVVDYGAPGFPTIAQGAAIGGGSHFFAGGPADGWDDNTPAYSQAILTQDLDIPTAAMKSVKAGGAEATISASDRNNATGLMARRTTARLPLTTTSLAVAIDFDRASGAGTYNDAYADNVSVRIITAGSAPPEPDCSPIASPAPGGSTPSPGGPAPTPSAADSSTNTAVPLARVGRRVRFHRGFATLKLRCVARDVDCAGSVRLTSRLGRIGSGRFDIARGEVGTIKVRIGRAMRHRLAALSHKRLSRLKVTATARLGAATTRFTFAAAS
jgi:hypothetical protein